MSFALQHSNEKKGYIYYKHFEKYDQLRVVKDVVNNDESTPMVCKILRSRDFHDRNLNHFREYKILKKQYPEKPIYCYWRKVDGDKYPYRFYLIMPKIEGVSLDKIDMLNLDERSQRQIVEGLKGEVDRLHACGIIHSDIKPENVIVSGLQSDDIEVHLVDYGTSYIKGVSKPEAHNSQLFELHDREEGNSQFVDTSLQDEARDYFSLNRTLYFMFRHPDADPSKDGFARKSIDRVNKKAFPEPNAYQFADGTPNFIRELCSAHMS